MTAGLRGPGAHTRRRSEAPDPADGDGGAPIPLWEALDAGARVLLVSLGHRSGLLQALGELPGASPRRLAAAAGLDAGGAGAWLQAAAAAGLALRAPGPDGAPRYRLSPEGERLGLASDATPGAAGALALRLGQLAAAEDALLEGLRSGGAAALPARRRLRGAVAEAGEEPVEGLLDVVLAAVPGLREALRRGTTLLAPGCGDGSAVLALAAAFPASHLVGVERSDPAREAAAAAAARRALPNARFVPPEALREARRFPWIVLLDPLCEPRTPEVVAGLAAVLEAEGTLVMRELASPTDGPGSGPPVLRAALRCAREVATPRPPAGDPDRFLRRALEAAGLAVRTVASPAGDPLHVLWRAHRHG